ncbi:dipeptidase PepV [Alteribacter natronophilus]|uniref:dipeptidase PepV n=1 Tax=Alteribacter natronophilus TaxID=2583810 RepID=UPI00110E7EC9|nr:dipeptidase PepV [Alteribacter natronophilus]TMW71906.1 dipeptidase PepV [Alteribacter natronophilus]
MNWKERIDEVKETVIEDTRAFLRHKSVLDESTASPGKPFGEDIARTYNWLLQKAENEGFKVKDFDGYAGHIEYGTGEDIIGILCHLDVVPEGDGWTSPPFEAELKDGRIIARGAIDDKGPTMAAYHALKTVKESGVSLGKRVRLIIGTDEESQWRCVEHYFRNAEMPVMGFAPDADFPIIYSEKGICDLEYSRKLEGKSENDQLALEDFRSGQRLNMVPDQAQAVLSGQEQEAVTGAFRSFLESENFTGDVKTNDSGQVHLILNGKSVHGMEPDKGINAGLELASFLSRFSGWDSESSAFVRTLGGTFARDSRGKTAGIAHHNEELGDLTVNLGILEFIKGEMSRIGVNLRYPETADFDQAKEGLDHTFSKGSYTGTIITHEKPHKVAETSRLVSVLKDVYERHTGEKAELIAIGGGTYARSLNEGVAFGPLFPGRADLAHQPDEAIHTEDLLKATAIYADAIYELAK